MWRSSRVGYDRRCDDDGLAVEQRAKIVQRRDRDARPHFVGELLTRQRI
jgi:hypothetical protein